MDEGRHDLLALLLPVSRELRRVEKVAAARHGLSMWQYAILSVVDRLPGPNQLEVADVLGYSKNRLVGDLDHLEREGLLTRRPGEDRRSNVLTVTGPGRRVMTSVRREIHRHEDQLLAPLSTTTRRVFVTALRTLDKEVRRRR